jgi:N-acetylglucosaminyldiphosphoundecaprenol N-acetyl-beta-D-mannosaminyltransferase
MDFSRSTSLLLGSPVDVTTQRTSCEQVFSLADTRTHGFVCYATAHMLVEATRDSAVRRAYASADLVNPDGVPLMWLQRLLGHPRAECVTGPRSFPVLLKEAAERGTPVGFYGGREETLQLIEARLKQELPALKIGYSMSPPFRPLTTEEQEQHLQSINDSGIKLLFVGLGSPKQECWMNQFSPKLNCVCLGVGAAFEFFSGEKVLPPLWVQKMGLNWLIRLAQEPRRLVKRNLTSTTFVLMSIRWILTSTRGRSQWTRRMDSRMMLDGQKPLNT